MRPQRTILLPILSLLLAVAPAWARTWTDTTGRFSIEAELVEVKDGRVWLKKADGKVVAVPLERLSKADRGYLESLAKEALAAAVKALRDPDKLVRQKACQALGEMGSEAVLALMTALNDMDYQVRYSALDALGNIGPEAKEAVPTLTKLFQDGDNRVRMRAAKALGNIGPEAMPAAPALIRALSDEGSGLGATAAEALVKMGPETVPALAKALQEEDFAFRRVKIVSLLGKMGSKAVPALRAAVEDKQTWVRWNATDVLGNIGPEAKGAAPALLKALRDADVVLRWKAAESLGNIGPQAEGAVSALTDALEDDSGIARMQTASALGRMGPEAKQAIPALKKALQDRETVVRRIAAEVLRQIEGRPRGDNRAPSVGGGNAAVKEAVSAAIKGLGDKDAQVRMRAASALSVMVHRHKRLVEKAIPELTVALQDEEMAVRRSAVSTLGMMGPELVPVLIRALEDESSRIRRETASALARMGPSAKEAIPSLTKALLDIDDGVRRSAAGALGNMGPEAIPVLAEALRHEDGAVQLQVAEALGEMGREASQAVPALISVLGDKDISFMVRRSAAEALGNMGREAKAAAPALKLLLQEKDIIYDVKQSAAEALRKIEKSLAKAHPGEMEGGEVVGVLPPRGGSNIVPPTLAQDRTTFKLPSEIKDVCVGGGGRYLVLYLQRANKLAIFDVNVAEIVHEIPVPGYVRFAAGLDKLIICSPSSGALQRWDLATAKQEAMAKLDLSGDVTSVAMGHESRGPLLLATRYQPRPGQPFQPFRSEPIVLVDVATLKKIPVRWAQAQGGGPQPPFFWLMNAQLNVRAAANGRAFGIWRVKTSPSGLMLLEIGGSDALRLKYEHKTVGHVIPGPDGCILYTARGLYSAELVPMQQNKVPPLVRAHLPATNGQFYLSWDTKFGASHPRERLLSRVTVHLLGDPRSFAELEDFPLPVEKDGFYGYKFPYEKRVHFIPEANLIVKIPHSNDQLILLKFDAEEALRKSDLDYLYVNSEAPDAATRGKTFSYPLRVRSRNPELKFNLKSSPSGMSISESGEIRWDVPPQFPVSFASVVVSVKNANGQECSHSFTISIRDSNLDYRRDATHQAVEPASRSEPDPSPPPILPSKPPIPADPPQLAVAPFDEAQAKRHQQAWADYLGVPVEYTNSIGMKFRLIPPGEFPVGALPGQKPRHRVRITKPFYLGKYEATQSEWKAVMGDNPSKFTAPMNPVEWVTWEDVQVFLTKLNAVVEKQAVKYALPTEAQWEYACRAGTTTTYSFGKDTAVAEQYAWFKDNSGGTTHAVGKKTPNAWGLHDMVGNVWEWCADWYAEDFYHRSPVADPIGAEEGLYRVIRGGALDNPPAQSAARSYFSPRNLNRNLGFRVVLVVPDSMPARKELKSPTEGRN